jgi:hypothetical protein
VEAAYSLDRVDPDDSDAVKQLFNRVVRARRTLLYAVATLASIGARLGERELRRLPQGWTSTVAGEDAKPPNTDAYHAWAWLSDNALRFRDVRDALRSVADAVEAASRATGANYERRASAVAAAVFELQAAVVPINPTSWTDRSTNERR